MEDAAKLPLGYKVVAPNGVSKLTAIQKLDKRAIKREDYFQNEAIDFETLFAPLRLVNDFEIEKKFVYEKGKDQGYWAVPEQVYNLIMKQNKMEVDVGTQLIKKLYDKFTMLWKAHATAVNPGFHIRNVISNQFNNYLDIGSLVLSPKIKSWAYQLMKENPKGYIS